MNDFSVVPADPSANSWVLVAPDGTSFVGPSAQEATDLALRVTVESISAKQQKLLDLANRIDHEQLWRLPGMEHPKLSPEQRDRLDAGVSLRRYANLLKPNRWLLIPPTGVVQFSGETLDSVYTMARRDEQRKRGGR